MKRPKASLPKLPSKARPAADPMNHSRPALAFLILLASLALLSAREPAGTSPAASAADLRRTVEFLASEELAGRMTGSKGSRLAADYLAAQLQEAGLQPGGDKGTFFQDFEFSKGIRVLPERNWLHLETKEGKASVCLAKSAELSSPSGQGRKSGSSAHPLMPNTLRSRSSRPLLTRTSTWSAICATTNSTSRASDLLQVGRNFSKSAMWRRGFTSFYRRIRICRPTARLLSQGNSLH